MVSSPRTGLGVESSGSSKSRPRIHLRTLPNGFSVPFGALSIAGLVLLWDRPGPLRLSFREIVAKIDIIGITLLLLGSLLLVFGIEQGGAAGATFMAEIGQIDIVGRHGIILSLDARNGG